MSTAISRDSLPRIAATPPGGAPAAHASSPQFSRPSHFIHRELDDDGVCHLIFDAPGGAANVFNIDALLELEEHLNWLEQSRHVAGLIVSSAHPRIFIAGADLKSLSSATTLEIDEMIERGQGIFTKLERLRLPKIAVIHGACLGGGFEFVLCCDRRLASDDSTTKIGLPETQLGLLPAWGGCTRLPRLIGVSKAADVILTGTQFSATEARKRGLVDEVMPRECLVKRAKALVRSGRVSKTSRGWTAVTSPVVWLIARRRLMRQTRGNYPALFKALNLICGSPWRSTSQSLTQERREFNKLVRRTETQNLVRLFFDRERAKKLKPPGSPARIKRVAVIGAGIMGSGIAYWLSTRGWPVLLLDVKHEALAAARQRLRQSYAQARRRGLLTDAQARLGLDRVTLALNEVPLRNADLVIEAATEDATLKGRLFVHIVARARPDALLATNTSAIPVGSLHAEPRIIGLHFFNPVHAMPLVEVVRPEGVSDDAAATAVKFVQDMGKLPIVVKDSPGFLVNRILMPYLMEAARMVDRGVDPRVIDDAMRDFGMPMGPLRLLDEVGLDVALDVAKTLGAAFPRQAAAPSFLADWLGTGRLGKKSGLGFYSYKGGGERPVATLWRRPAFGRRRAAASSPVPHSEESALGDRSAIDPKALQTRLSLLLTNEAARCLDEEIASSASDIDLAMVLGTGYPPFRGGPLRHADATGLQFVAGQLQQLENLCGPAFAPAEGLLARIANDGAFFSKDLSHETPHSSPT